MLAAASSRHGCQPEHDSLSQLRLSSCELAAGAGGAEWKAFLAKHPQVVKRRVRKGIPNALRSLAWQLLSGGRDLLLQNEGKHVSLCPAGRFMITD